MNPAAQIIIKTPKPVNFTPRQIKNFWNKVNKNNKCWLWIGSKTQKGYGLLNISGRKFRAHRASWIIHGSPIPDGIFVLHKCDVPSCVNPKHLFLGTNTDNMRDKENKGRGNHAIGDRNGSRTKPDRVARGEKRSASKLTSDKVIEIRKRYFIGGTTQKEIAKKFGVSSPVICNIINLKSWTHIK